MILGKIVGRLSTLEFEFQVSAYAKKFDYVQVMHKDHGYVLCQIVELVREPDRTVAKCMVLGFKDKDGRIKQVRTPFYEDTEVLLAEDDFIKSIIHLEEKGAYIGLLEGRNIPVYLNLNKLLTKHVAVLAKSGAGKSYAVGVLLEEIMEKKVPLLIIDPHGEYSSMRFPNDSDNDLFAKFDVEPKGYSGIIREFSPDVKINKESKQLRIDEHLTSVELLHMLPAKLSSAQSGVLYSALKNLNVFDFDDLIIELEKQESSMRWGIINLIDYLKKLNIFSASGTDYSEIIRPGKCSVINFRGVDPVIQEIIVYKLLKDLYMLRKSNSLPPFFVVVEEAHNFCPERGFGEKKSSIILRDLASEGRKFGLGLCIISQRPARVEKSILSQCSTQIILKVTNPNDLKAIAISVEGITNETEEEVKNLPIGSAMVTGVVDMPLFTNIRVRKSKHGGEAVNVVDESDDDYENGNGDDEVDVLKEVDSFDNDNSDLLPVILPKTSIKDLRLMNGDVNIKTYVVPSVFFVCEKNGFDFNLLFDLYKGELITSIENGKHFKVCSLDNLSIFDLEFINGFVSNNGVMPSDHGLPDFRIQDFIKRFMSLDLIDYDNGHYELVDGVKFLFNPENYSTFENVEFKNLSFDVKLDARVSVDDIKKKFADKLVVKDKRDCFIVFYIVDKQE